MLLWMIPGELLLAASTSSSAGPQITLIPSSGHVGDNVQLIGEGLIPDQDIIISIDGSSILAYLSGWDGRWQVISEDDGSLEHPPGKVTCSIPNLPGRVHIITAQDGAGDTAAANVTVLPQITISKLQGATGVQVTATGSGLQANATLSITFNNAVVTTTKPDALGAFKQDFTVPLCQTGATMSKSLTARPPRTSTFLCKALHQTHQFNFRQAAAQWSNCRCPLLGHIQELGYHIRTAS